MTPDPSPDELLEQVRAETARLRLALVAAAFPLGVLSASGRLAESPDREKVETLLRRVDSLAKQGSPLTPTS